MKRTGIVARSLLALYWLALGSLAWGSSASLLTAQNAEPFRLNKAIDGPDWVRFSGLQRTRFESLNGQFRSGNRPATEDQWFTRTSLRADFDFGDVGGALEMMDSRAWGNHANGDVSTGLVNTTDIVNGYVTYDMGPADGDKSRLLLGRYTMTQGSRRFVIRNGYRNTVNTFTGVDYLWKNDDGEQLRAFWTMPVRRRPFDAPSLRDNQFEWDDQDIDLQFFGVFGSRRLDEKTLLEGYVYGLHEDAVNSNNRRLITPGWRVFRPARPGEFFGELEGAFQFGRSQAARGVSPTLDHQAYFAHGSIGYTWDCAWQPAVRVAFDHATGDRNPNDGENNRFDTLFGAPRFDYGPTGLWGAVQRSNLSSPELRFSCKPTSRSSIMVAFRDVRLASSRDQWIGSGVADTTGASGDHVGQQYEFIARYDVLPGNLQLEIGGAYLAAGRFLAGAPNAAGNGDSRYGYVSMNWRF